MSTTTPHTAGQMMLEFLGWSVFVFFVLYIAYVYGMLYDTLSTPLL